MANITTYSGGILRLDLMPILEAMQAEKPTFISAINFGSGKVATSTKHSWHTLTLTGTKTTLDGAVTATDTFIDVVDGSIFSDYDTIMIKDLTPEVFTITVSTNRLTLFNPDNTADTAAYDHDTAGEVVLVASPRLEASDNVGETADYATLLNNYTQIFRRGLKVSGTEQVINLQETDMATIEYFTMQKMQQIYRDLNNTALFGRPYLGTDAISRKMGGLHWWLTDTSSGDPINKNFAGGDLTLTAINDLTARMVDVGGNADLIVCGVPTARKITALANALGSTLVVTSRVDDIVGNTIQAIQGDFLGSGLRKILVDPNIPDGSLFMVNQADLKMVPLNNRTLGMEEKASVGDYQNFQILGEYTLEIQHVYNNHAYLFNFLTAGV